MKTLVDNQNNDCYIRTQAANPMQLRKEWSVQRFPIQHPAETPQEIARAAEAQAAYSNSSQHAAAGRAARKAMQWRLAAVHFDHAAEALPLDPNTYNAETIQATAHRREAAICRVMACSVLPPRLIKNAPEYGHMQAAAAEAHAREWDRGVKA